MAPDMHLERGILKATRVPRRPRYFAGRADGLKRRGEGFLLASC